MLFFPITGHSAQKYSVHLSTEAESVWVGLVKYLWTVTHLTRHLADCRNSTEISPSLLQIGWM